MTRNPLPLRPYPGLRPFHKHEWAIFFGREAMVDAVEERLARRQLVVVHGSSGCGKSSLVKAGILPRLEHEHGLHGVSWRTAQMRPGTSPLWNLAEALARLELGLADDDVPSLETTRVMRRYLDLGERALPKIEEKFAIGERGNVCLLLDQFEELFRYAREIGREEADTLVEVLRTFERTPPKGIYALVTMRSDHLGDCSHFPGFAELVNDTQYLLPSMDEPSLIRAIREPARLFGGDVDMELTLRLVEESRRETDALPLVQHALMRLWQQAGGGSTMGRADVDTITRATPHPMLNCTGYPGLQRILSEHADEVLKQLSRRAEGAERVVEHLFRGITEIDADGRGIRRPMKLSDLHTLVADEAVLDQAIEAFSDPDCGFLMSSSGEDPVVDISHEALIRCWRKLNNRRIDKSTGRPIGWLQREQEDSRLWRALLVQADAKEIIGPALVDTRQEFFNSLPGSAWAERYEGGWGEVRDLIYNSREARNESVLREEETRRRDRKLRNLFMFISIAAVLCLGVATYFWVEAARSAKDAEDSAYKASLAASREKAAKEQAEEREREAELARSEAEQSKLEAEDSKKRALEALERVWAYAGPSATSGLLYPKQLDEILIALEFLPDVSSSRESRRTFPLVPRIAKVLAMRINEPMMLAQIVDGHDGLVRAVAHSKDGNWLATGSHDGTARIIDSKSGEIVHEFKAHSREINAIAFSPDGTRLLTSSQDRTIASWDLGDGGNELFRIKRDARGINDTVWSPDGTVIASASKDSRREVWLWNGEDGSLLRTLDGKHVNEMVAVAFSPDGARVVGASSDGTASIWRVEDGEKLATLRSDDRDDIGPMSSVDWSADGRIAIGTRTGVVRLWDADSASEIARRENLAAEMHDVAFSPDSRWLAASSSDGRIRVLNVRDGLVAMTGATREHIGSVEALSWSADGEHLVTGSNHGHVYVYRVRAEQATNTRSPQPDAELGAEQVQALVDRAKNMVPRCLSETDRSKLIFPQDAPEWCEQMAKPPFHPEGRVARGLTLLETGEFEQAERRFRRALELTPSALRAQLAADIETQRAALLRRKTAEHLETGWLAKLDQRRLKGLREKIQDRENDSQSFKDVLLRYQPEFQSEYDELVLALRIAAGKRASELGNDDEAAWHFERALKRSVDARTRVVLARAEAAIVAEKSELAALLALELLSDDAWETPPDEAERDRALKVLNEAVQPRALLTVKHGSQLDAVAFSPDGTTIATGASDNELRVWRARDGKLIDTLKGHTKRIPRVRFSPDGTRIVTSSFDGTARVWNLATADPPLILKGHERGLWGLAWSADGSRIATGGEDNTARIWDAASGRQLQVIDGHEKRLWDVALSPDGSRLLTGSSDGTARIWDTTNGKELSVLDTDSSDRIYSVAWSDDGALIATGTRLGTASIWDAASGKPLHELDHGKARVWAVAFSPDGRWLATGATDKVARIFDTVSGELRQSLRDHDAGPDGVDWSHDGMRLVTGSNKGVARVWAWAPDENMEVTEQAKKMISDCLSPADRSALQLPPRLPSWCPSQVQQPEAQTAE